MERHFHREIEKLKSRILSLSAYVEDNVLRAVKSVKARDTEIAKAVLAGDRTIDAMEVELEEECLKILTLHQPLAADLRLLVALLKINNDLERIGDLAVNIAVQAFLLPAKETKPLPFDLTEMTEKVRTMLRKSLDALVELDIPMAREVLSSDDEIDDLNRATFDMVKKTVLEDPNTIDECLCYLMVSRGLERIADHATNIAEDVIYMTHGEIVRHFRTKIPGE